MNTAKFIVFEGGEGSGKSTHIRLTAEYLKQKNISCLVTHEPGGTEIGKKIRSLIVDKQPEKLGATAELLLFLADRAHHVESFIQPQLESGMVVLCDRFSGSTLAYQIGARELPQAEFILQMEAYARHQLTPDHVIYLDVDPEVGIGRKNTQKGHEMNRLDSESLEFHRKVRAYFQKLAAEQPTWKQFDANRSMEEVQEDISKYIDTIL
ncbi:MAG: dTMP kinase [Candidatus Kerfeldbacteria bacterium]|nr:dTMP kinase [Candidatus Kerfeldbacteria bacterium]